MGLELGSVFEGKVTGITKFGVFVDFADGKTGMVHISEVASTFVKEISDFVKIDQVVKVKVTKIGDDGKIALSMKQAEPPREFRENRAPRRDKPSFNNNQNKRPYKPVEPKPPVNNPQGYEWQAKTQSGNFEDMLSKFKQTSDEKISSLKRNTETKRGGNSRRER